MDHGFEINSAAQERLADFRQQAEHYRLAKLARAQRRPASPWFSTGLIWLGQRLTQWGRQLQHGHEGLDVLRDTAM
jgi:hypothetical protein